MLDIMRELMDNVELNGKNCLEIGLVVDLGNLC